MRVGLVTLAVCLGFGAAQGAAAADAYVIETEGVNVAVGTPVKKADTLKITGDGYVVLLTKAGELVFHAGPYGGPVAVLLGPGKKDKGTLKPKEVKSLLALAKFNKKAPRPATETGATADKTPFPPDERRISPEVRVFCRVSGTTPVLVVPRSFSHRERLIVRRQSKPTRVLRGVWPAGVTERPWPNEKAVPEAGYYVWSAGYMAARGVWIKEVPVPPADLIRRAAVFKGAGCTSQALVAFRKALTRAKQG